MGVRGGETGGDGLITPGRLWTIGVGVNVHVTVGKF
jgi:hypothetical protein